MYILQLRSTLNNSFYIKLTYFLIAFTKLRVPTFACMSSLSVMKYALPLLPRATFFIKLVDAPCPIPKVNTLKKNQYAYLLILYQLSPFFLSTTFQKESEVCLAYQYRKYTIRMWDLFHLTGYCI